MSDGFTLGGLTLDSWETPEQICLTASQKINKHVLIGGQRQIDAMGPDPDCIKWSGRARGANASADMNALRAMTVAGAAVPLTWNQFYFLVMIKRFDPHYQRPIEWTYEIEVEIVDDPMADSGSIGSASLDSLVGSDLQTLAGLIS